MFFVREIGDYADFLGRFHLYNGLSVNFVQEKKIKDLDSSSIFDFDDDKFDKKKAGDHVEVMASDGKEIANRFNSQVASCHQQYRFPKAEDQMSSTRVEYTNGLVVVKVLNKRTGKLDTCLSFKRKIDFDPYIVVVAESGSKRPDSVVVKGLRTIDLFASPSPDGPEPEEPLSKG